MEIMEIAENSRKKSRPETDRKFGSLSRHSFSIVFCGNLFSLQNPNTFLQQAVRTLTKKQKMHIESKLKKRKNLLDIEI
jgi:hypothetical protein